MTDRQIEVLLFLTVMSLGFLLGIVFDRAAQKAERVECQEWLTMDGFQYVEWQKEQCERYNLLPD